MIPLLAEARRESAYVSSTGLFGQSVFGGKPPRF